MMNIKQFKNKKCKKASLPDNKRPSMASNKAR